MVVKKTKTEPQEIANRQLRTEKSNERNKTKRFAKKGKEAGESAAKDGELGNITN